MCEKTTLESPPLIIAAAGDYSHLIDQPLTEMSDSRERDILANCLSTKSNIYEQFGVALYLGSSERGDMCCFVACSSEINEVDRGLLELFCSNISICADNIELIERFRSYAFTDQLVGLPNRNALTDYIDELIKLKCSSKYSLVLTDIDNFAEINAALGQQYGDELLKAVAVRLTQHFPEPAMIARIAGDTFAIVTVQEALNQDAVSAPFSEVFDLGQDRQLVSATSGMLKLADIEGGGADVLKSASVLLKLAKNQHRGESLSYQPSAITRKSRVLPS